MWDGGLGAPQECLSGTLVLLAREVQEEERQVWAPSPRRASRWRQPNQLQHHPLTLNGEHLSSACSEPGMVLRLFNPPVVLGADICHWFSLFMHEEN